MRKTLLSVMIVLVMPPMEVVEPALGIARGCYVGVSGRAREVEELRGRLVLDLVLALSDVTGTGALIGRR